MDDIDDEIREKMFGMTKELVIAPEYREPDTGNETLEELRKEPLDYDSFKEKCYELCNQVAEIFLVNSIVYFMLSYLLNFGDKSSINEKIKIHEEAIEYFKDKKEKSPADMKDHYEGLIKKSEDMIEKLPSQTEEYYEIYIQFCEEVLAPLYIEEVEQIASEPMDDDL